MGEYTVKRGIIRSKIYEEIEGSNVIREIKPERKLSFDLSIIGGAYLGFTNFLRGRNIPPGWEIGGRYVRPRSRTAELLEHQAVEERLDLRVKKHLQDQNVDKK